MFDRRKVGRTFHRHADEYDRFASVQQRVVRRLMELLEAHVGVEPRAVLDIGCGTGALSVALKRRYPQALCCGLDLAFNMVRQAGAKSGKDCLFVNGDAEQIPFRGGSFDLVISASTLQWLDSLDGCLEECRRIVKKNGLIGMAFFGGATSGELRKAIARRLPCGRRGMILGSGVCIVSWRLRRCVRRWTALVPDRRWWQARSRWIFIRMCWDFSRQSRVSAPVRRRGAGRGDSVGGGF